MKGPWNRPERASATAGGLLVPHPAARGVPPLGVEPALRGKAMPDHHQTRDIAESEDLP